MAEFGPSMALTYSGPPSPHKEVFVTRYAIDRAHTTLLAQWSTGIGDTATVVAPLTRDQPREDTCRLAAALTRLSGLCWRAYTHPAGCGDLHDANRRREREAFAKVLPALIATRRPPDLPDGTEVERAAHDVARVLQTIGASQLTTLVTTDVAAELAAVEQAERGDLSERARQAVELSREDASPLQISRADRLLRDDPCGGETLLTEVDPTAAAIAAAHWFHAALAVTARHTGLPPERIVAAAGRPGRPLAVESLTGVTAALDSGVRARQAVIPLIRTALHVAEGHLCGLREVRRRLAAARDLVHAAGYGGCEPASEAVHLPLTALDPVRPAPDLLRNLLHGIRTCLLHYERHDRPAAPDPRVQPAAPDPRAAFVAATREEAAARTDRLL
ncbi:hypothetical protein ACFMQL_26220 [Nonomuraea fastidiosa]|uniref:hypothetical protein n=1 Tax=Nonomuraea fastidiosa TaxID=46173 RepID=UPI0036716190